MNIPVKIAVVAGSLAVAEELLSSIQQIFGDSIIGTPYSFGDQISEQSADLFICFISRKPELVKSIPLNKVIGVEMIPSPKCCVKLATLPSNETRWVFCNSRRSAKVIVDFCCETGLSTDRFDYATFEDIPEQELLSILGQAKYIVGVSSLVSPDKILYQRYAQYLRPDCEVIAVNRILSPTSVAAINQRLTSCPASKTGTPIADCPMKVNLEKLKQEVANGKMVQERLEYENSHDPLTGLYNRRHLELVIEQLPKNCSLPLAVISLDFDRLKFINDTYGHDEGDTALIEAANIISQSIGPNHIVARVGGDEFVAILQGTDEEAVSNILAKLFDLVRTSNRKQSRFPINLSIGYAIATSYTPIRQLLKSADSAMYKEKASNAKIAAKPLPS